MTKSLAEVTWICFKARGRRGKKRKDEWEMQTPFRIFFSCSWGYHLGAHGHQPVIDF